MECSPAPATIGRIGSVAWSTLSGYQPGIAGASAPPTACDPAGDPTFGGVLAAAAAGAFVGDTIAYLLGRYLVRPLRRASAGRANATAARIRDAMAAWGGGTLIVARFIPGGRTLATVSAGSLRYPIRRFWVFTAVAGVAWGTYTTSIGYLGGALFDSALPGAVGGLLLASGLSIAVEAGRRLVRRRTSSRSPAPPATSPAPPTTRATME
ncbi:hypothetical protein GCM10009558_056010 [Virgisporangium aurantiacum]